MKVKAASQKVNLCQITKLCSLWFSVFASLTMLRITTVYGIPRCHKRNVWLSGNSHGHTHTHSRYPLNRKCIAQVWGSTFSQRKEGGREHRLPRHSQKPARSRSCWLGKEGLGTSVHGSVWTVHCFVCSHRAICPFTCPVFITRFNFSKND